MAGGILPVVDSLTLGIETPEPQVDPTADSDEEDDSDEPAQAPTLQQLRATGDPNDVGRTPVLGSDDIPVEPGSWPIGYPLQAVPRVAVTLNLNYVYNEETEQWERDTGNRNSGTSIGAITQEFPAFGDTVTPDEQRPSLVYIEVTTESAVADPAQIDVVVNDSGTGLPDRFLTIARFEQGNTNKVEEQNSATIPVPAGGTVRVANVSDPVNDNQIEKFIIHPLI